MSASHPELYLLSPVLVDADAFAPELARACATGAVAAVLLRFVPGDERGLINRLKRLAPVAQEAGAAVLIPHDIGFDAATVMARGGADGIHVGRADLAAMRDLRRRLGPERSLGAGGLASRDDAMEAGEVPCDYVLFGEPREDGRLPALEAVVDRASWWSEIFVTPCAAYAPDLEAVSRIAATGAEFVALGEAVWTHPDGAAAAVAGALRAAGAGEAR